MDNSVDRHVKSRCHDPLPRGRGVLRQHQTLKPELRHLPRQIIRQHAQRLALLTSALHLASRGAGEVGDALDVAIDLLGDRRLLLGGGGDLVVDVADALDLIGDGAE
ncbi:hypothetical protein D9M70_586310 [compost metagenome]